MSVCRMPGSPCRLLPAPIDILTVVAVAIGGVILLVGVFIIFVYFYGTPPQHTQPKIDKLVMLAQTPRMKSSATLDRENSTYKRSESSRSVRSRELTALDDELSAKELVPSDLRIAQLSTENNELRGEVKHLKKENHRLTEENQQLLADYTEMRASLE